MSALKSGDEHRAASILVANQLIAAGGAFLMNLIASRVLDPSTRGEFALALQLSYVATTVALLGLERPFMATARSGFSVQYQRFVGMLWPGAAIVVVLVVVLSLVPGASVYRPLIIASATFVLVNLLVRSVRVAYVASRNWRPFVVVGISAQLIIVVGALLLAVFDVHDPALWMLVYTASGIAPIIILFRSSFMDSNGSALEAVEKRSLRVQGAKLLPASLGNTAMVRSDRLLLPAIGSSADLGIYITVATVMEMAAWPVQQWVDVSLRRWSSRSDLDLSRLIPALLLKALGIAFVISLMLGGLSFLVVTYLLPVSYLPATAVIVPLGVASMAYSVTRVQQGVLVAAGAAGHVSIVEAVGWISSAALYILLIPSLGIVGAALGSIGGYSLCAAAGFVALRVGLRRGSSRD